MSHFPIIPDKFQKKIQKYSTNDFFAKNKILDEKFPAFSRDYESEFPIALMLTSMRMLTLRIETNEFRKKGTVCPGADYYIIDLG
jgi:hypothetical protein